MKKALAWICEGEPKGFLQSALHQQGLLQLHEDFFPRGAGEIWEEYSGRMTDGAQLPLGD